MKKINKNEFIVTEKNAKINEEIVLEEGDRIKILKEKEKKHNLNIYTEGINVEIFNTGNTLQNKPELDKIIKMLKKTIEQYGEKITKVNIIMK